MRESDPMPLDWKPVAKAGAVCVMLLILCGFGGGLWHRRCNVTIGPAQSVINHDSTQECINPGLVTLPDGHLLAAFYCIGKASIVTQLSKDRGATWGHGIAVDTGMKPSTVSLSLLHDGKLFLSTSLTPASGKSIPAYLIGTIGAGDEITWGAPVLVDTPESIEGCAAVSPVVYLRNGDLLWPVWCFHSNKQHLPGISTVLISTDGGVTWPRQVTVAGGARDGRDFDESAAVVYPNGDVVMMMRQTTGCNGTDYCGAYWRSQSTEGATHGRLRWRRLIISM